MTEDDDQSKTKHTRLEKKLSIPFFVSIFELYLSFRENVFMSEFGFFFSILARLKKTKLSYMALIQG